MGTVGTAALLANFISFGLLWAYREGANMRSAWVCTRNDVLGNLAVSARPSARSFGRVHWLKGAAKRPGLSPLRVISGHLADRIRDVGFTPDSGNIQRPD
jgi:hypothetical protein